ncbi:hypothetical protein DFJ73DRAFT_836059 [Zopfochytrium polystomum]|nr:hypothetical protein DFJ73DRAFT_836059 [Zopfochytrium polystomum]
MSDRPSGDDDDAWLDLAAVSEQSSLASTGRSFTFSSSSASSSPSSLLSTHSTDASPDSRLFGSSLHSNSSDGCEDVHFNLSRPADSLSTVQHSLHTNYDEKAVLVVEEPAFLEGEFASAVSTAAPFPEGLHPSTTMDRNGDSLRMQTAPALDESVFTSGASSEASCPTPWPPPTLDSKFSAFFNGSGGWHVGGPCQTEVARSEVEIGPGSPDQFPRDHPGAGSARNRGTRSMSSSISATGSSNTWNLLHPQAERQNARIWRSIGSILSLDCSWSPPAGQEPPLHYGCEETDSQFGVYQRTKGDRRSTESPAISATSSEFLSAQIVDVTLPPTLLSSRMLDRTPSVSKTGSTLNDHPNLNSSEEKSNDGPSIQQQHIWLTKFRLFRFWMSPLWWKNLWPTSSLSRTALMFSVVASVLLCLPYLFRPKSSSQRCTYSNPSAPCKSNLMLSDITSFYFPSFLLVPPTPSAADEGLNPSSTTSFSRPPVYDLIYSLVEKSEDHVSDLVLGISQLPSSLDMSLSAHAALSLATSVQAVMQMEDAASGNTDEDISHSGGAERDRAKKDSGIPNSFQKHEHGIHGGYGMRKADFSQPAYDHRRVAETLTELAQALNEAADSVISLNMDGHLCLRNLVRHFGTLSKAFAAGVARQEQIARIQAQRLEAETGVLGYIVWSNWWAVISGAGNRFTGWEDSQSDNRADHSAPSATSTSSSSSAESSHEQASNDAYSHHRKPERIFPSHQTSTPSQLQLFFEDTLADMDVALSSLEARVFAVRQRALAAQSLWHEASAVVERERRRAVVRGDDIRRRALSSDPPNSECRSSQPAPGESPSSANSDASASSCRGREYGLRDGPSNFWEWLVWDERAAHQHRQAARRRAEAADLARLVLDRVDRDVDLLRDIVTTMRDMGPGIVRLGHDVKALRADVQLFRSDLKAAPVRFAGGFVEQMEFLKEKMSRMEGAVATIKGVKGGAPSAHLNPSKHVVQ